MGLRRMAAAAALVVVAVAAGVVSPVRSRPAEAAPSSAGLASAAQRTAAAAVLPNAGFYGSTGAVRLTRPIVGMAASPSGRGYWLVASDGGVFAFGDARFFGSTGAVRLTRPIVGMAASPSGRGYWLVASDGGVFAFGDARFFGSTGAVRLTRPIVGMAASPSGRGYWLVASDGGVFAFGDARFFGSTGAVRLTRPIVGMAASPSGRGYWLVASDGGVFAFGDARFFGSTGAVRLTRPIVGMAASPSGRGYWLVASDGGVFAFGDARFFGSTGAVRLSRPIVGMAASRRAVGYWLLAADGGLFAFSPATPVLSPPGSPTPSPGQPGYFATLPVGATLPSDATCASRVRPEPEVRPANTSANHTRGAGPNTDYPVVDGNYVGTTDEIIQWAACKWGIDENVARAQTAVESWWFQRNLGDFSTDPSTSAPGHQTLGADGQPGECPQSVGLLQVRYPYHQSAFQNNNAGGSSAYNEDFTYAVWRDCYNGNMTWLNGEPHGKRYAAGDLWGCIGVWYSGRWYTSDAITYIDKVQGYLNQRIWETADFLGAK